MKAILLLGYNVFCLKNYLNRYRFIRMFALYCLGFDSVIIYIRVM